MALSAGKMLGKMPAVNNFFSILKQSMLNGNRFLYSKAALGLNGYDTTRTNHKKQFTNLEESFRNRMLGFIEKPNSVIFSEDLKAMLYIVEKDPKDLDLVMKMIKRYHEQKKQLRFANFTFGPVVMRAFYYLDEPDIAFEAFKDPQLNDFFDQLMSIQILMDLLYNHQKYEQCMEAYNIFTSKPISSVIFPRNASIIAAATYYQLNTSESLEQGLEMLKSADAKSVEPPRRTIYFIAALALKQNRPEIAVELIARAQRPQYITSRCIKLEAYAQLKRFDEILMIFKQATTADSPSGQKRSFFMDTIEQVEQELQKEELPENSEILKMINYMRESGYVQNKTLEGHLTSEMGGNNEERFMSRTRRMDNNRMGTSRFSGALNNATRFEMTGQ